MGCHATDDPPKFSAHFNNYVLTPPDTLHNAGKPYAMPYSLAWPDRLF